MVNSDQTNGYEEIAQRFLSARNPLIGAATVRDWSVSLPPNSAVLDLGCGSGIPVSQSVIAQGHTVYGIDASPTMIAAYRKNFPAAHAQCAAVEDSDFFGRSFDAIVAWGFLFC